MSSHESVTEWLSDLKRGDSQAAGRIWNRYLAQLFQLARRKLRDAPRRAADEEDVMVAAFASFCRGAEEGRFAQLDDRDDLWQLLIVLTERKAIDQIRRETAQRRGGGEVRGESAMDNPGTSAPAGPDRFAHREPTPQFAALVAEQTDRLLGLLVAEQLVEIAAAKMEGHTNQEVADRLGVSLRGVERKLNRIRKIWEGAREP